MQWFEQNLFLPAGLHCKFCLSVVKWYMWPQTGSGGWLKRLREDQEPQDLLNQKLAHVLTCLVQGGWEHTAAQSPTPVIGEALLQLGAELSLSTLLF